MQRSIAALIVAAGRGQRAGGERPKQYAPLGGGATVLGRALDAFLAAPLVDTVRVVIHPDDAALYRAAAAGRAVAAPVAGGASRQQSVRAGLEALAADPPALVLIHDAARPFVGQATIAQVIGALAVDDGAIAAVPVADTLKQAGADGMVAATRDRAGLWQAQTPQGFRFPAILAAHRAAAGRDLTDDAAVAEAAGIAVRLVPDRRDNFKITTADDLARARLLAGGSGGGVDVRCGHGFDTHRLIEDAARPLMLCGVAVPGALALAGHSDADVGLHALTDALLGAAGRGDIGQHFPPSDPRWQGAPSATFLRHAADIARAEGFAIAHADVTVICERPKVGPHRDAMRAAIAALLAIAPERVSVKATTTERLGYTGRGEGIAALASATLVRGPQD
ncbi:MAG: bifunctional 2-C-methyl-D-erythritol 4-phosphate cytidylyltransferase/2-C-methyl-D-erythritol 2,4-cyclodiphosphate synthase [Alphaproteobacteria bacterium]